MLPQCVARPNSYSLYVGKGVEKEVTMNFVAVTDDFSANEEKCAETGAAQKLARCQEVALILDDPT